VVSKTNTFHSYEVGDKRTECCTVLTVPAKCLPARLREMKVDSEVASQIWEIIMWVKYWVLWFQMKMLEKSEMSIKV